MDVADAVRRLVDMTAFDAKADLHLYLQDARDALLWKLDGLSEYDVRRPLTPSGTNLLGLVKHVTAAEAVYFGETFGRPFEAAPLWIAGRAEPNADLWATAQESREEIVGLYRRVWAHSDETIRSLPLDATGRVGWGRRAEVTLHRILVHAIAETDRHAGHADIVRELVDGGRGLRAQDGNLPEGDDAWWKGHRDRVEQAAREAAGLPDPASDGRPSPIAR
ncbi:DinB family protein [Kitasatospora arboriphila]|uniref:DinB family protein n=2 Tax=Kitasatospora arboriphila TaxID=258052 RepID=A0ABN1TBI6_9ACTN